MACYRRPNLEKLRLENYTTNLERCIRSLIPVATSWMTLEDYFLSHMQKNGSKLVIFLTFLADPEKMMKKYFLNVYEKVFVPFRFVTWHPENFDEISGVKIVEIFRKNGQKSMKNGRFGSVFMHVT